MSKFAPVLFVCLLANSAAFAENALPRWALTLTDGSHIAFVPHMKALPIESEPLGAVLEVPVWAIAGITFRDGGELSLKLQNGDRVSGPLKCDTLTGEALFGTLQIEMRLLRDIDVVQSGRDTVKAAAAGEFQLDYAGLRWDTWRTGWGLEDGALASLRHVRPGFRYGHWANGRGGMAITGNGDQDWTDYDLSFDYKMLPANREFFHAHIPGETRGMTVFFRAKSLTESWNQPDTGYAIGLNPTGTWTVVAFEGHHIPGDRWSPKREGKYEKLATGKAEDCGDASQGRLRIRVKGNRIKVWLGDELLTEITHSEGEIEPVLYGGFGVQWRYESMGQISNLEVERF